MFGVHQAIVASLKTKREQDYLLVECVDGSVAVWEKGTGDLEGVVYGQVAREISENSDTVSFLGNYISKRDFVAQLAILRF
jgi:hypothetical protein